MIYNINIKIKSLHKFFSIFIHKMTNLLIIKYNNKKIKINIYHKKTKLIISNKFYIL